MNIIKLIIRIKSKIKTKITVFLRRIFFIKKLRKRLKNKNFSIIASNCNGCVITYDLGIRYNSPTVNLYFKPREFIELCSNLEFYMNQSLVQIYDNEYSFWSFRRKN